MTAPELRLFQDDLHDEFARWPLAYTSAGGPELAEILAIGEAVGDGDDHDFARAFGDAGDASYTRAEAAAAAGHRRTASDFYLRAAALYGTGLHPLYGAEVDPELLDLFARQSEAFSQGLALLDRPATPLLIPYEQTHLPGMFIPAQTGVVAGEGSRAPLLICTNGYDATMPDMYFASAVAATRRGYHVLLFDGPGQGAMLYTQGVPMRPDWEVVIRAVVDVAERLPGVDPGRIALSGWSLGGYLAPRAATGEPRLAACIADPGQPDLGESMAGFARALGAPDSQVSDLATLDDSFISGMQQAIEQSRRLRWSIVQRGFWVNGVSNLREFIAATMRYTLVDRLDHLRCPTLVTRAENDPLAAGAQAMFDALSCPKTLLTFGTAEQAADHCEMGNRSLLNARVLDWLDSVFVTESGTATGDVSA